jgi:hypothetical protein
MTAKNNNVNYPIHVLLEPETVDYGNGTQPFVYLPGWYFWDETGEYRHGPFNTRKEAINACRGYSESL